MASLFNKSNQSQVKQADISFMSCILKVNKNVSGWQLILRKVLGNMNEVKNFEMVENGMVLISGTVSPTTLLKVLARGGSKAEIVDWQFGECSNNLFLPVSNHYPTMINGYGTPGGYGSPRLYGTRGAYDQAYYNWYGIDTPIDYYDGGYGENNNYHVGYGASRFLDNRPCPWPVYPAQCGKTIVEDERDAPLACCTIM